MEITSIQNKLIKDMTKLHKKKYRDETGLFLVEGYHLYEEAKKAKNIEKVFTIDHKITGDNVYYVTEQILEKLAQMKSPQGVVTICKKVTRKDISDRVLLLNHVQDPGNLGTLLRSALAFGFNTIVLDNTVDLYNDKVLRSTQGALYKLNIIEEDSLKFIDEHPDYLVYGTAMNGQPMSTINKNEKLIVILGNEGQGVEPEILKKTTENITIKTQEVDSLNVGVAGSILMHFIAN